MLGNNLERYPWRDEAMSIVLTRLNRFRKIVMPNYAVNGTLFVAVRYRYHVRVIPILWDFHDFLKHVHTNASDFKITGSGIFMTNSYKIFLSVISETLGTSVAIQWTRSVLISSLHWSKKWASCSIYSVNLLQVLRRFWSSLHTGLNMKLVIW